MTTENQLIQFDPEVTPEALATLQEQAKTFPVKITDEKEYKTILEGHRKVKKIRIAVDKKGEHLKKAERLLFEAAKTSIITQQNTILAILHPMEAKLLETRTAWEDEKERIKQEKANIEAEKQQEEFERQEKIREEIRLKAEFEELRIEAYAENERFDQRKREDEARLLEDERLKKERLAFEKEKAAFEAKKLETLPIKAVPSAGASEQLYEYIDKKDDELLIKPQPVIITTDNVCTPEPEKLPLEDIVKNEFDKLDQGRGLSPDDIYTPELDPDKAKFDEIFKIYYEMVKATDRAIEAGFTERDATEAAKYIKQELNLLWKNLHGKYDF